MSDETGVEHAGADHTVGRKAVNGEGISTSIKRRKVDLTDVGFDITEKSNDQFEPGEVATEVTMRTLEKLSNDLVELYIQQPNSEEVDLTMEEAVRVFAEFLCDQLPFVDRVSGLATLQKQLDHLQKVCDSDLKKILDVSQKTEVSLGLDCKGVTFLTAEAFKRIAEILHVKVSVNILKNKYNRVHPSLYLEVQRDGITYYYFIDFRTQTKDNVDVKTMKFDSREEKIRFFTLNSISVVSVRSLDDDTLTATKKRYELIPVSLATVQEYDQAFIDS